MFTRRSSMKVMRSCVKRSSRRSSRRTKSRSNSSTITVAVFTALLIAAVQLSGAPKGPGHIILDGMLVRDYAPGSVTLADESDNVNVTDLNQFGSAVDAAVGEDYDLAATETSPEDRILYGSFASYHAGDRFLVALSRVVLEKGFVKAPPRAFGSVLVPEPNTALLMGMGLTLLAGYRRRRELV